MKDQDLFGKDISVIKVLSFQFSADNKSKVDDCQI